MSDSDVEEPDEPESDIDESDDDASEEGEIVETERVENVRGKHTVEPNAEDKRNMDREEAERRRMERLIASATIVDDLEFNESTVKNPFRENAVKIVKFCAFVIVQSYWIFLSIDFNSVGMSTSKFKYILMTLVALMIFYLMHFAKYLASVSTLPQLRPGFRRIVVPNPRMIEELRNEMFLSRWFWRAVGAETLTFDVGEERLMTCCGMRVNNGRPCDCGHDMRQLINRQNDPVFQSTEQELYVHTFRSAKTDIGWKLGNHGMKYNHKLETEHLKFSPELLSNYGSKVSFMDIQYDKLKTSTVTLLNNASKVNAPLYSGKHNLALGTLYASYIRNIEVGNSLHKAGDFM